MPDVLAEVRSGWVASHGSQFLDAIHGAIVETLHTPEDDKVLRLVEHPAERLAIPGSACGGDTPIEITTVAGRSLATKHSLYQAIVRNLQPFGVPGEEWRIILM